ncbi:DUF2934 domain-containing protein [Caballeronia sp. GAWG2-1]|uniref:DUF2934 domain-containing protein n=1 Tax=Caballeronia sp. GAWG2-1 TaxID=2921744 RepID=UPI002028B374|nr:DUF2934 domain-containing protein [Caballeronia sp. GAWG2-1]
MQLKSNNPLREDAIRLRAYYLWEADGRQHGHDDLYWDEAIAQLQNESRVASSPTLPDVLVDAADTKRVLQAKKGASTSKGRAAAQPDHDLQGGRAHADAEPVRTTEIPASATGAKVKQGTKHEEPPAKPAKEVVTKASKIANESDAKPKRSSKPKKASSDARS